MNKNASCPSQIFFYLFLSFNDWKFYCILNYNINYDIIFIKYISVVLKEEKNKLFTSRIYNYILIIIDCTLSSKLY